MAERLAAIGCMRLSTLPDRNDDNAVAVIHAALDAGVRLLDTADAYAHHTKEVGHNERLIARALSTWDGDVSAVTVATKGGLTRPGGKWVPDGRAKHLRAACEASLRNLGVARVALYQLHAPDPKVALRTSVRALAKLQRDGLVDRVGLCNVSVAQIEEARSLVEIASVQVSVSPFDDNAVRGGVVTHCESHGIDVLAHRPLGGAKLKRRLERDPAITAVAERLGATPAQVVLAWLRSLAVTPLPGPTRTEAAATCGAFVGLDADDIAELDARYSAADILRRPQADRRPAEGADGEVVILMGIPGAGKSTEARTLVDNGYARLNRDLEGGTLSALVPKLDDALTTGARRVVLDNTYPTRRKRNEVIETAWAHGVPVRCAWMQTTIEDARVNAVHRMLDKHERLLEPEEIAAASRSDPNTFAPRAQLNYQRDLEPPVTEEGFVDVDKIAFERTTASTGRLLLIDLDAVAVESLRDAIRRRVDDGWGAAGFAWRPADESRSRAELNGLAARLGFAFEVHVCSHPGGPPICWCRPPMPGLVVVALRRADADPAKSLLVGSTTNAERFAAACGVPYEAATQL